MSRPSKPRGQRHPVDVLFASIADGTARTGDRYRALGHGKQRHRGAERDQGRGRHEPGAVTGNSQIRRHAEKRHRGGHGRSRACAGRRCPRPCFVTSAMATFAAPAEAEPPPARKARRRSSRFWSFCALAPGTISAATSGARSAGAFIAAWGSGNIETLNEYMDELRANPEEVQRLVADLMINVTGFFRDAEAWRFLPNR